MVVILTPADRAVMFATLVNRAIEKRDAIETLRLLQQFRRNDRLRVRRRVLREPRAGPRHVPRVLLTAWCVRLCARGFGQAVLETQTDPLNMAQDLMEEIEDELITPSTKQLFATYNQKFGKSIPDAINAAFGAGPVTDLLQAQIDDQATRDAIEIHKAMKGMGTNEMKLIEMLVARSPREREGGGGIGWGVGACWRTRPVRSSLSSSRAPDPNAAHRAGRCLPPHPHQVAVRGDCVGDELQVQAVAHTAV